MVNTKLLKAAKVLKGKVSTLNIISCIYCRQKFYVKVLLNLYVHICTRTLLMYLSYKVAKTLRIL